MLEVLDIKPFLFELPRITNSHKEIIQCISVTYVCSY